MRHLIFAFLIVLIAGCSMQANLPEEDLWPDDQNMTRLDKDVEQLCEQLVADVAPGSLYLSWYDNLHPSAPMLAEAYVVSMMKGHLNKRGFVVNMSEESAEYRLHMTMTPSRKSLLTMATLSMDDRIIATGEANFVNGSEQWGRALRSKRYRTTTVIPVEAHP